MFSRKIKCLSLFFLFVVTSCVSSKAPHLSVERSLAKTPSCDTVLFAATTERDEFDGVEKEIPVIFELPPTWNPSSWFESFAIPVKSFKSLKINKKNINKKISLSVSVHSSSRSLWEKSFSDWTRWSLQKDHFKVRGINAISLLKPQAFSVKAKKAGQKPKYIQLTLKYQSKKLCSHKMSIDTH